MSATEFELLHKYNVPVPRYTSYPTVPFWNDSIDVQSWQDDIRFQFAKINRRGEGISLYLHLPFCESLCTYCGCNKKITTNHSVENDYMAAILKEWQLYKELLGSTPMLKQMHLGGGTPTFFSPEHLKQLISGILDDCNVAEDAEFSIEGHPNNTTEEHLKALYELGFRRISYGVQDLDPVVQFTINRIQPFENVVRATEQARNIGYTSVNFDLIYGLPKQNPASLQHTIEQVLSLKPDRIAFYSYAHVPWTSKGQRLFDENDLPSAKEKLQLYQLGKSLFLDNGYCDIGMDHFALPHDELYIAQTKGKLHRNFMGYTTVNSSFLLGLGVSAISDTGSAFAQNTKTIHDYYAFINKGELAVKKGYFLTNEDVSFRKYILDISCTYQTQFNKKDLSLLKQHTFPQLEQLEEDGLITWNIHGLEVTPLGRNFTRNICSAFDIYLTRNTTQKNTFSKAI